jgi:hypothetical protein
MRTTLILAFLFCIVASCATTTGPVYIAKTEGEAVRTSYEDPALSRLSTRYQAALKEIYHRYETAGIDVYPGGIGFTSLADQEGKKHYYLLVEVRPRNIAFGEAETKSRQRFNEVFEHHFQKNLLHLRPQDLPMEGVDGVAFAVYWIVRDLSKCDQYGGFLEYMLVYFPTADFIDLAEGNATLLQTVAHAEVLTSLDRKPPESVRVTTEK